MPLEALRKVLQGQLGAGFLRQVGRIHYDKGAKRQWLELQFAPGKAKGRAEVIAHLQAMVRTPPQSRGPLPHQDQVRFFREALKNHWGTAEWERIRVEAFDHPRGRNRTPFDMDLRTVRIRFETPTIPQALAGKWKPPFRRSGNPKPENRPGKPKGWKKPGAG